MNIKSPFFPFTETDEGEKNSDKSSFALNEI